MDQHDILIDEDGTITFVYSDDLAAVFVEEHDQRTVRASFVEPCAGGGWTADMSLSRGPSLGPFVTRQDALEAERAWLSENRDL